jgi:Transcriptional activator of glycolytic enzymes
MLITAKLSRRYKAILTAFFSFLHEKEYKKSHEFTDDELRDVTHKQVLDWFKFKCFGTINPIYDEKLKVKYRKASVLYWKKALSHFLSNEQTRSEEMNQFTKYISLLQVRKKGKESKTVIPLKDAGFQHLIQTLKCYDEKDKKDGKSQYRALIRQYGIPAMLCYQFAMIGRLDDCTQALAENLECHDKFPTYALKSKITWSKNVLDERDAPWQILLGSLLTVYCVFVNVGIWLEIQLENTPGVQMSPYIFSFSQDFAIPSGGKKASSMASKMIGTIFRSDKFYEKVLVGTHSIRKFAATYCRNNDISKDDVESRGRWKDGRRVANRYEDPTLPYVDTKACFALCQGGACTYIPRPGCITQEFLCVNVVPGITRKFGANVAMVLGSAVMWTIFSSHSDMVPAKIQARVIKAYNMLSNKLPDGENPIEQRKLYIAGEGNSFTLASSSNDTQGQVTEMAAYEPIGSGALRHFVSVTIGQLTEVRQGHMTQLQRTFTTGMNRLSRQPHRFFQRAAVTTASTASHVTAPVVTQPVVAHTETAQELDMDNGDIAYHAAGLHATLSPAPRNLYALWQEYYFGIDGRKPAKDFSPKERGGARKVTYCRRKKFWLLVAHLIRSGSSADDACKKIYDAYGHEKTVTSILNSIAIDKSNGTLPISLR